MNKVACFLLGGTAAASLLAFVPSCSGGTAEPSDAGIDRRFVGQRRPTASCEVVLESPDLLSSPHVPNDAQIQYNSVPPSSGPHFQTWANFMEFPKPVPMGHLVHSMEHGAVVLFYKCASPTDPGCADLVAGLRKVRDSASPERTCSGTAIRARVVIVPEPSLPVPIAAAAWGFTYRAQCVDIPTLTTFVAENIGHGTEDLCVPGETAF